MQSRGKAGRRFETLRPVKADLKASARKTPPEVEGLTEPTQSPEREARTERTQIPKTEDPKAAGKQPSSKKADPRANSLRLVKADHSVRTQLQAMAVRNSQTLNPVTAATTERMRQQEPARAIRRYRRRPKEARAAP